MIHQGLSEPWETKTTSSRLPIVQLSHLAKESSGILRFDNTHTHTHTQRERERMNFLINILEVRWRRLSGFASMHIPFSKDNLPKNGEFINWENILEDLWKGIG